MYRRTRHVNTAPSRIHAHVLSEKRSSNTSIGLRGQGPEPERMPTVLYVRFFRSIQSRKDDPVLVETVVEVAACVSVKSFCEFCSDDGSR